MKSNMIDVGSTYGLTRVPLEHYGLDVFQDFAPEQAHVRIDGAASKWTDADNRQHEARRILVEGTNGYGTRARLRLTHRQAEELSALLTRAIDEDKRWAR